MRQDPLKIEELFVVVLQMKHGGEEIGSVLYQSETIALKRLAAVLKDLPEWAETATLAGFRRESDDAMDLVDWYVDVEESDDNDDEDDYGNF